MGNREKKGEGPVEPDGPGFYVNQRGGVVTSPVACSWEVDAGPRRSELTCHHLRQRHHLDTSGG